MAEDIAANRLRYLVEQASKGQVVVPTAATVKLPPVAPPSLEGLEVRVPAQQVEEEDLIERFEEYRREAAEEEMVPEGTPVERGHEVLVDVVGYCQGKLLPFSVQSDTWLEVQPDEALPGFCEGLEGVAVGDTVEVEVVLPEDYPQEEFAGQDAIFVVDIKEARRVTLPSEEDAAFLQALGMGATLEEAMEAIGEELEEELEERLWEEAQDKVLEALAQRTQLKLSPALIDEEIRRSWLEEEGEALQARDFSEEELKESFEAWRTSPELRHEAEVRLKSAAAMDALARAHELEPSQEAMDALLEEMAEAEDMEPAAYRQALAEDEEARREVEALGVQMAALDYVMEQASIIFEGAEDEEAPQEE